MNEMDQIRECIREWMNKQGHDKCWYYPDLFARIAQIAGINISDQKLGLPPEEEFEQGCRRYKQELYDNSHKVPGCTL